MRSIALFLLSFSKEFGLRNTNTELAEVLLLIMLIDIMSLFRPKRFGCLVAQQDWAPEGYT